VQAVVAQAALLQECLPAVEAAGVPPELRPAAGTVLMTLTQQEREQLQAEHPGLALPSAVAAPAAGAAAPQARAEAADGALAAR
jgi:hypothetical protein